MKHWLMKSEPSVFSIDDLKKKGTSGWDGVRNYQARNFMKEMALGDRCFFYHSSEEPMGVAGVMEVCRLAYPDPTQFDKKDAHYDPKAEAGAPIWFHVDVKFVNKLPRLVPLAELRGRPELRGMALFRLGRISITPVSGAEWETILGMSA